jgi:TRAP-type mannitol/chloroaromatic compound transport system permease small subunit
MFAALRAIDSFNERFGRVLSWLNLVVVGTVVYEIVSRYAFNAPTLWANETMIQASAFLYVLAAGYAQLHGNHVKIDALYMHFGKRTQAVCDVFTWFFFSLFMLALVWQGGVYALDSLRIRESSASVWDPPIWPLKCAIPIGALLLWLQRTADVIRKVSASFGEAELERHGN